MQSKTRLENQVALIVGGGQIPGETIGNGRATALTFAREGAKIVIADIDINLAKETVRLVQDLGGEAFAIEGDIINQEDCSRFVSETIKSYGGLNILQNNVGIGPGGSGPNKISAGGWRHMLDVNLTGMFLMIKNVIPIMQKQRSGVIPIYLQQYLLLVTLVFVVIQKIKVMEKDKQHIVFQNQE